VDAAFWDKFFYEPEAPHGGLNPDEIFYKGKFGAVRQIVSTSNLSRKELQEARDNIEAEIRAVDITY